MLLRYEGCVAVVGALPAGTPERRSGQNAFGDENFQTLPVMLDRPLPVLGSFSAADELELVRSQPRTIEVDARPFAAEL